MLKRITVGILMMTLILAVGCGRSAESLKETDGIAEDRVSVEFKVPVGDERVSALLQSLGSHIVETLFYGNRVLISVPEDDTVPGVLETLKQSKLVECAEPYYLFDPDEVTVKFNVSHDDERVTALLESLGSQIARTYEYSDFVLVSVPEDKTVADMIDVLSNNPLVDYAEPNYYVHI